MNVRHYPKFDSFGAARDISLAPYRDWIDAERIIVNIYTSYRDFGAPRKLDVPDYHVLMARLRHSKNSY